MPRLARLMLFGTLTLSVIVGAADEVRSAELQSRVVVGKQDTNASVRRCANALISKAGMIKSLAPKGLEISTYEEADEENSNSRKAKQKARPYVYVGEQTYGQDLVNQPFVFRDAEHVLAFLQSGAVYEEIRDNPTITRLTQPRLAIAYGGFYQMFSKSVAVTEPRHFYHRFIGGAVRASRVYGEFNALINPYSGLNLNYDSVIESYAAKKMAENDSWTHMVEAHLASAIENGFEGKGDYVNLISSTALMINIGINNWDDVRFSPEELLALRAWASAAAIECSEANYQKELDTLDRLKADGYEIVPFNRRALVELSWRLSLEEQHGHWTIAQFDKIVSLGEFPKNGLLPSAMLNRMTPQKRNEALKHDSHAIYRMKEWKENNEKYFR